LKGVNYTPNQNKKYSAHASAFSALIEYFTKTNDKRDTIIYDIYKNVLSTQSSVGGLLQALNETENIWWPGFLREFIKGNIFDVPGEKFLKNITETIEFDEDDTVKYVRDDYNDLSAKLYKIEINSEEILNNKSFQFKVGPESLNLDYVKVLVFGVNADDINFISEGINCFAENISKYDALLACVVNSGNEPPYTGNSTIELEIRVINKLSSCKITTRLIIKYKIEDDDSVYTRSWQPSWKAIGEFKGNKFTGNIDPYYQGENTTGSISVSIDPNTKDVTYFNANAHSVEFKRSSSWSIVGKNIPHNWSSTHTQENIITGTATCERIDYAHGIWLDDYIGDTKITRYGCDDNSMISIELYFP
jgi:hypothetical protein